MTRLKINWQYILLTIIKLKFQFSRRRKEYRTKSSDGSNSDENETVDTSNIVSENDIRLRSKKINEDNSDS